MHLNIGYNMSIKLNKCNLDYFLDYINDNSGEFGIGKTKFGEVPSQQDVGYNIEEYLKYSLSIDIGGRRPIGIIFLKEIFDKTLELSIIIKEEYRRQNILKDLLKLNNKFRQNCGIGFLNSLLRESKKSKIVTSVTKDSSLERMLISLGFILEEKSAINNKMLYSLC